MTMAQIATHTGKEGGAWQLDQGPLRGNPKRSDAMQCTLLPSAKWRYLRCCSKYTSNIQREQPGNNSKTWWVPAPSDSRTEPASTSALAGFHVNARLEACTADLVPFQFYCLRLAFLFAHKHVASDPSSLQGQKWYSRTAGWVLMRIVTTAAFRPRAAICRS